MIILQNHLFKVFVSVKFYVFNALKWIWNESKKFCAYFPYYIFDEISVKHFLS